MAVPPLTMTSNPYSDFAFGQRRDQSKRAIRRPTYHGNTRMMLGRLRRTGAQKPMTSSVLGSMADPGNRLFCRQGIISALCL